MTNQLQSGRQPIISQSLNAKRHAALGSSLMGLIAKLWRSPGE